MRTPPKHVIAIISALCLLSLLFLYNRSPKAFLHWQPHDNELAPVHANLDFNGHVIMGKLGNETIKAELGRSTWKLIHTMMARFPLEPTAEERTALKQWITLLSRLYPCGECADHFQLLLQKYPPQTSSRDAAAQWACVVHNKVNERLTKPVFDCGQVAEMYKCGCDDEDDQEQ